MSEEKNNSWRLSKTEQMMMWAIGILLSIVIFVFAKWTVSSDVRANTSRIDAQEIRYEQVVDNITDIKQLLEKLGDKFDKFIMKEGK